MRSLISISSCERIQLETSGSSSRYKRVVSSTVEGLCVAALLAVAVEGAVVDVLEGSEARRFAGASVTGGVTGLLEDDMSCSEDGPVGGKDAVGLEWATALWSNSGTGFIDDEAGFTDLSLGSMACITPLSKTSRTSPSIAASNASSALTLVVVANS